MSSKKQAVLTTGDDKSKVQIKAMGKSIENLHPAASEKPDQLKNKGKSKGKTNDDVPPPALVGEKREHHPTLVSVKDDQFKRAKAAVQESYKLHEEQIRNLLASAPANSTNKLRESKGKLVKTSFVSIEAELENVNNKIHQLKDSSDEMAAFERELEGMAQSCENDLSRIVQKQEQVLQEELNVMNAK